MKVDTFFQSFELLTDAPNAVVKLREIILQLAVMGKLVPQFANDEPASVLLEKIKIEKEELVKQKKLRKPEQLLSISASDLSYEAPKIWEWVRLDSICYLITDGTHHTPKYTESGVPFLSVKDVSRGEINLADTRYISREEHEELIKRCHPEFEDVLLTKVGTTGIAKVIDIKAEFSIFVSLALLKFSKQLLFPYYIELALNSPLIKKQSARDTQGIGNKNLVLKYIKNFIFPLPPLAEQKRIVEKCDRLLSICDEIEKRQQQRQESIVRMNESAIAQLLSSQNSDDFCQHWQRICNNFDLLYSIPETIPKLRQAILQLAVQGKLVRQDPNDEPASALVKRMISKRDKLIANKKINNYKPQPPIELNEIAFHLPNGWECVRLGEITDIVSGVTKGRNLTGRKTTYYPYLRVANVQRGFLNLEVMKEIEIPVEELEKYRLLVGDILLTEGGDWDKLGRSAIWQGQIQDCIHQNHVFRARPLDDGLLSEWAVMYTNSPVGRQYFETAAKRTTNLASINMTQLRYCPFPLPPLAEQKRIVEKCDRLMSLCDTLEAKLKQGRDNSEKLMEVAAKQVLTA